MKKIALFFVALFSFVLASFAQTKPVEKAVIPTPTVQCGMCKAKIEKFLNNVDGVQEVKVDVKKKSVTVKYLTDRTNIENIKTDIANLGYDAGDVAAEPDAYKKLPKCCKKPEDRQ